MTHGEPPVEWSKLGQQKIWHTPPRGFASSGRHRRHDQADRREFSCKGHRDWSHRFDLADRRGMNPQARTSAWGISNRTAPEAFAPCLTIASG